MSETHELIDPDTYLIQGVWEIKYDNDLIRVPNCKEPTPLSKFKMEGLKIVSAHQCEAKMTE